MEAALTPMYGGVYSPGHRFACPPSLRLRRKEGKKMVFKK
jgi:hypothetical protein